MTLNYDTPSLPVRALFALKAAVRHPMLLIELARKFLLRVSTTRRHTRRVAEYAHYTVAEEAAIAAVTSASPEAIRAALSEPALASVTAECLAAADERGIAAYTWAGFGNVCYAICRLNRPTNVLETGVAFGWTSAFILAALDANGHGHLYSVDLPAFRQGGDEIAGAIVPSRLRSRWTLQLGPQSQVIPRLLDTIGAVDFFHYDSDKTYHGMRWAYDVVWPRISPGGVVMSDDLDNDAFLEFALARQQVPRVIVKPTDQQRVGLLKRTD